MIAGATREWKGVKSSSHISRLVEAFKQSSPSKYSIITVKKLITGGSGREMCGSVLNPWDNGGIHGISRRTPLCSESCACWAERTILLNLSKSAGLWDSCRGFTAQVVLTLPTQTDFGLIPKPCLCWEMSPISGSGACYCSRTKSV